MPKRRKFPLQHLRHRDSGAESVEETTDYLTDTQGFTCNWTCVKSFFKAHIFLLSLLTSVVLSVISGLLLSRKRMKWTEREIVMFTFPGELFVRMIQILLIPLIFSSVIAAVGNIETKASARIATRAWFFFMFSTFISVLIAITFAVNLKPGKSPDDDDGGGLFVTGPDPFLDLIRNVFTSNIVASSFQRVKTHWKTTLANNGSNNSSGENGTLVLHYEKGVNILGILTFCLAFGFAMNRIGSQRRIVHCFFVAVNATILKLVTYVINFMPIGLYFLISARLIITDDPIELFVKIVYYSATLYVGLLTQAMIADPLLYFVITRKNPFLFLYGMRDALLCAFSTCSSTKTIPLCIRCAKLENRMSHEIANFIIPLGGKISKEGTAMYEVISTIFFAQVNKKILRIHDLCLICLTSCLAAISTSGIPGAAIVTVLLVMDAENVPTNDISFMLLFDWFNDRFVTMTNICGITIQSAIVEKLSMVEIEEIRFTRTATSKRSTADGRDPIEFTFSRPLPDSNYSKDGQVDTFDTVPDLEEEFHSKLNTTEN